MRRRYREVLLCCGVIITAIALVSVNGWAARDEPSHAPNDAERIVQQQLEAYNRRDLNDFLATYAETVILSNFPDELLSTGIDAMRTRYGALFDRTPDLHAEITQRIVQGDYVIDHEQGTAQGREFSAVAIYEVKGGKIQHVWFVR
ncbi:nuclear transport factor 2 family protein [Tautonia marina]|uniref:nuclear transport factor 2 family protein n=1 Tax=Tautonia marina TaxID=2653855 RepID=UPI001375FCCA|nr:nuclear transport factor 2 family protein [Tautonia marina]